MTRRRITTLDARIQPSTINFTPLAFSFGGDIWFAPVGVAGKRLSTKEALDGGFALCRHLGRTFGVVRPRYDEHGHEPAELLQFVNYGDHVLIYDRYDVYTIDDANAAILIGEQMLAKDEGRIFAHYEMADDDESYGGSAK